MMHSLDQQFLNRGISQRNSLFKVKDEKTTTTTEKGSLNNYLLRELGMVGQVRHKKTIFKEFPFITKPFAIIPSFLQQDGAPPHFHISIFLSLNRNIGDYEKERTFFTKPTNLQEVRQRIIYECITITSEIITNIRAEFDNRVHFVERLVLVILNIFSNNFTTGIFH